MDYKDRNERLSPEDPVSSAVFFRKILDKFQLDFNSPSRVISRQWKEIVGEHLACCASFASIDKSVLKVKCKNGSSATLFRMNSSEVLKKINCMYPELQLTRVNVVID